MIINKTKRIEDLIDNKCCPKCGDVNMVLETFNELIEEDIFNTKLIMSISCKDCSFSDSLEITVF